ncbi:XRE family transcriptional regulator [Pseudonocardiaceae bacterium YIM PH 21723]|nr:XRE family transcriptional regulator [Pseudonocardiaceae bacterium YIM PH 21723]
MGGHSRDETPALSFGAELRRLREQRGLSLRKLARLIHYDPGHLSRVENDAKPAAPELASAVDEILEAGGALLALAPVKVSPGRGDQIRPAQLPRGAGAAFVGREDQLDRLRDFLDSEFLTVAIDGPPGVGKTALALRWAHAVAKDFPDGALFVDLRGYSPDAEPADPAEVLEEFLRAFGVHAAGIPGGVQQRAALYRSLLAGKRVLVVLDNAVGSQQVRPLLPGSPGCGVVVTSRSRLSGLVVRDNALRVTLNPMEPAEALRLLREVIGHARADAEPDALAALGRRCAYLPLALRLAAERVVSHPHHTLADLAGELIAEGDRLDVLAAEDDDESSKVRAVFSWSFRALPAEVARMFRLLGVFPGPVISVPAAAALAGMPAVRARGLLEHLAGVHLVVETGRDRYRMHDLLRLYAAELAAQANMDREPALTGYLDWYLHSAQAANIMLGPERGAPPLDPPRPDTDPLRFDTYESALSWCTTEIANLVGAVRAAVEVGLPDVAWKLATAHFNLFFLRKNTSVSIAAHGQALAAARAAGDEQGESWCLHNMGVAQLDQRDFTDALTSFRTATGIRVRIDDRTGLAWSLAGTGFAYAAMGQSQQAKECQLRAIEVFRGIEFGYGEGIALGALGHACRELGQLDEALRYLTAGLRIFEQIDDALGQGYVLVGIGAVHRAAGDRTSAIACYDGALAAYRSIDDWPGQADALLGRGHALAEDNQHLQARWSWSQALAILNDLGDPTAEDVLALLEPGPQRGAAEPGLARTES